MADSGGDAESLNRCIDTLKATVPSRLAAAARMRDLVERLGDRIESAHQMGSLCDAVSGWLRAAPSLPASVAQCRLLLKWLRETIASTRLDLPELEDIDRKFNNAPLVSAGDDLEPTELLRGARVIIAGGRPPMFYAVRETLKAEDHVAAVEHIGAGEGTGDRAASAASADWLIFVTTFIGHDDAAAIDKVVRNRARPRVVRLPDRRDGANTIVQLLRRTSRAVALAN